jgi:ribosome-associated translation inhibitor RaiA
VTIGVNRGQVLAARAETEDFYGAIDAVEAKLETQLRRYKERLQDRKRLPGDDGRGGAGGGPSDETGDRTLPTEGKTP